MGALGAEFPRSSSWRGGKCGRHPRRGTELGVGVTSRNWLDATIRVHECAHTDRARQVRAGASSRSIGCHTCHQMRRALDRLSDCTVSLYRRARGTPSSRFERARHCQHWSRLLSCARRTDGGDGARGARSIGSTSGPGTGLPSARTRAPLDSPGAADEEPHKSIRGTWSQNYLLTLTRVPRDLLGEKAKVHANTWAHAGHEWRNEWADVIWSSCFHRLLGLADWDVSSPRRMGRCEEVPARSRRRGHGQ